MIREEKRLYNKIRYTPVMDDHGICGSEVEPHAAGTGGQEEHKHVRIFAVERIYVPNSDVGGCATVQSTIELPTIPYTH